MNLKQLPLISEILPAFYLGMLLVFTFWYPLKLIFYFSDQVTTLLYQAGVFLFVAWVCGAFFDAVRNGIVEGLLESYTRVSINWSALYDKNADNKKIDYFYENYYEYYCLGINFVIASFCYLVLSVVIHYQFGFSYSISDLYGILAALIFTAVFILDVRDLRKEMAEMSKDGF